MGFYELGVGIIGLPLLNMIYFIGPPELIVNDAIRTATLEDLIVWLEDKTIVGVDTETEGFFDFSNEVIMLQIGDAKDQFVIDTRVTNVSRLKPFFESSTLVKVFWNAKFDVNFIRFSFGFRTSGIHDCFLAECLLTAGKTDAQLSLAAASIKYNNRSLNKETRNKFVNLGATPFTYNQIKYGAEDVEGLIPIKTKQDEILEMWMLNNTMKLEDKVVAVLADIEYNGMLLDPYKWIEVAKKTEKGCDEYIGVLDSIVLNDPRLSRFVPDGIQGNLFGYEERRIKINWGSPKDKLKVLNVIGIDVESSDVRALLTYRDEPLVAALIDYSKQKKLAESFGRDFIKYVNPITNRVHQNIWQILSTGRMSSREPNLTQIPSKGDMGKEIRGAFIASPGYKYVGGDLSQAELRIIADQSGDPLWIDAFISGGDLHSILASLVFNIPIEDAKKPTPFKPDITYRDVQKTINFGLAYGMSEYKLSATIDVSIEVARDIISRFFEKVPLVKKYLDDLGASAVARFSARTPKPFYRIRLFDQPEIGENSFKVLGSIERAGKNHPIQGCCADIVKIALVLIKEHIDEHNLDIRIVNVIHDEIITECAESLAEEWRETMGTLMSSAAKVVLKKVPMEVDCKITDYWKK